MSTVAISNFSGTYFTSAMPDVTVNVPSAAVKARITITVGDETAFSEVLWPTGGVITLVELGPLVEPFVQRLLVATVSITAQLINAGESPVGSLNGRATVLFCRADVGVTAQQFYEGYFLSILMGPKVTALGRLEYLWYYGQDAATATAEYSDGTTREFAVARSGGTTAYSQLDVSPDNFFVSGLQLVAYTVRAGQRSQRFELDLTEPDCAPILEFYNSFGVWELLYCTGTHKASPDYKRSSTRIQGLLRNYRIDETRTFQADTGVLTTAMAQWADDLLRSDMVYVVSVIDGKVCSTDGGKQVVITDSKSEQSNADDYLPRFTFSYQYAQRNHNVLQLGRVGRIFDNTFDNTFN